MMEGVLAEGVNSRAISARVRSASWPLFAFALAPVTVLMSVPVALYLLTLTLMLFRPPGFEAYPVDRVAFFVLVLVVLLRGLALRQPLRVPGGMAWPIAGLSLLAIVSALSHSYDATTWSEVGTKFIIPFTFFWFSGLVFTGESSLRWLERYSFVVLAYLTITAVAFLAGIHQLVFPTFILDESVGIHADRARGPFLQAVANGLSLNLLGLLAIERYRRGALRGWCIGFVLAGLPVAILATKTRSVWLAFAISVMLLFFRFWSGKLRSASVAVAMAGILTLGIAGFFDQTSPFGDRLSDGGSVDFRMAAYVSGWEMFLERPLTGWNNVQSELANRIQDFRGEKFAVHNTYLDILLEHGLVGFGLYVWLIVALFRLGRRRAEDQPAIASVRALWPLLLGVYLVNATFVVMNYPFVNGVLFSYAGILAARPAFRTKPIESGIPLCDSAKTSPLRGSFPFA
jgi:O-antigen ligase